MDGLAVGGVTTAPPLGEPEDGDEGRRTDRIEGREGVTVAPGETSLEDVFIQFMAGSKDNMG